MSVDTANGLFNALMWATRYDQDNGGLVWADTPEASKICKGSCRPGKIVGTPVNKGHMRFQFNGYRLMVHDIVWEMFTGAIVPHDKQIHHIDGNRGNNRIENLRLIPKTRMHDLTPSP